ncbi:4-alpha-glucanotransferase [Jatrophihabitans endophyticus]|uniref:4-alpha-glucanotransferase n=1 Tax=Jatrophihabitans endophyticus TaxID=1206085 RepID=UPI001F26ED83|nr:4-alpha-glucanotransferase [Jatrophihabitans endophyticus]
MNPLHELAAAYGVDAEVWSWQGEHAAVDDATLRAVLAALGADASSGDACRGELARLAAERAARPLPPYAVAREGDEVEVATSATGVTLTREDGTTTELAAVDGVVTLPADLPVGYHRLTAGDSGCAVIAPPRRVPLPPRLRSGPAWGLAAQLYSVRSRRSWGIGDLADLGTMAEWAAREHGADFVLVNPLHAAEVVAPMNPSPYSPTTRRFGNPMYLHVEDVPEYGRLDDATRSRVDDLGADVRSAAGDLLDRDAAWAAKRSALEVLHDVAPTAARAAAFAAYREREGVALRDFATWCAITDVHGNVRDAWPAGLQTPGTAAVAAFAAEHEPLVTFFAWSQWLLDEQLTGVQRRAVEAGMGLGIVHDVAVGVNPTGADAWALPGELATSVTVGAPPDAYSQTGQDWDQPPWRPDRLAALGYAPFRDLFAAAVRHSGGLRVDHVIGLFRLWWIPRGRPALAGTYVHYDHDAVIGILMIEAARAGAVLIGEDLGNVEPWVRDYLRERGIFGTSILWFEYDGDAPLSPERWRELCLASVTTHDLPPTTGYLAGDHVRLRHELGLLTRDYDEELGADRAAIERWLSVVRDAGLPTGDDEETVLSLHRLLGRAPSLLRCAALTDAVGDRRIQNQPGTTQQQHPNWQVPLSGPDGTPLLLDDVLTDGRAAAVAAAMRAAVGRDATHT